MKALSPLFSWKIMRKSSKCASCSKDFGYEKDIVSTLFLEEGIYQRKDYCIGECSNNVTNSQIISTWETKYSGKEKSNLRFFTNIESTFFELLEKFKKNESGLIYLLATYLERKKILKLLPNSKENQNVLILKHTKRDEIITIRVPDVELIYSKDNQNKFRDIIERDN